MLRRVRLPTAVAQGPLRFPLPQRRWTAVTPPLESPVPTDTAHPTAVPKKKRKTAAAAATTGKATVAASAPSAVSPAAAAPKPSSAADPYRPQYLQVKKQLEAEAVAAAARVSQERARVPPSSAAGDVPARDSTRATVASAPATTTAKETRSGMPAQAKSSSASSKTSSSDDGSRGSASKDAVKGAADVPCSHDDDDPSTSVSQGSFLSTVRHFVRSWQNGILGGIGIVTGIGVTLYVFWTPFHSDTVHQTSVVASNVLSDDKVKESAVAATKEVVEAVLRDESSVDLVVDLIDRLLKRDAARQTTGLFLKGIFEDRYTQEVTKKFVLTVVQDEWVRDQLLGVAKDLAIDLLEDESTRDVMKRFLVDTSSDALKTESLHKSTAKALRSTAVEVVKPW